MNCTLSIPFLISFLRAFENKRFDKSNESQTENIGEKEGYLAIMKGDLTNYFYR